MILYLQKIHLLGGLFFFLYDAKHKDTLPYWDRFPLVIPIEIYSDGFLGLNLHYLPIVGRQSLLNRLLRYKVISDRIAYMKVSYKMLASAAKTELFKPCIHRYLSGHIKSKFVKVYSIDWVKVIKLPVQKFIGKQPW